MNLVTVTVGATDPEPVMACSLILHECDLHLPRGFPLLCKSFEERCSSPEMSRWHLDLNESKGCWLSAELLKS
jgi:hypothetical protein